MQLKDALRRDGLAIFLFHGVTRPVSCVLRNYTRKHLPQDEFYTQLKALSRHGSPVSMDEVLHCARSDEPLPPFAFAVTFDDGFENNHSVAAPVLADLGLPACFYVTTDFIEHNSMSWIDRIEYVLETTPKGALSLPWREDPLPFSSVRERIALLEETRQHAKQMPELDLEAFADDVARQCGQEPPSGNDGPLDKKMSWSQVAELSRTPGFTVGGHTVSHAILGHCAQQALEAEIGECLRLLAGHGDVVTEHFSYPEGLEHCYSPQTIEVLRRHGVACCPTAIDGWNPPRLKPGDLFHLKRIMAL